MPAQWSSYALGIVAGRTPRRAATGVTRRAAYVVVAVLACACVDRNQTFNDVQSAGDTVGGDDLAPQDGTDNDVGGVDTIAPDTARDAIARPDTVPVDVPTLPLEEFVVPGTPAITGGVDRFGGPADPSRAPSIVYPTADTIVPPNVRGLEVHFLPGTGNDLFEVSFRGGSSLVRIYTRCTPVGGGCILTLTDPMFGAIVRASRPGPTVRLMVRATSDSAGGRFGASRDQALGVSDMDLSGAIYYWAAGAGTDPSAIIRYDWAVPTARRETFARGDVINCIGCHSVSRHGERITIGRGLPYPATTRIYDVATRAPTSPEFGTNYATYSPDATRMVISDGNRLSYVDATNGAAVPGLTAGTTGSQPDWSADGLRLIFSRHNSVPPFMVGTGGHDPPSDLVVMDFTGGAFTNSRTFLATASGENNYYPAFSPDNNWVIWNRGRMFTAAATDAQLWIIPYDRMLPPRQMAAASPMDTASSWPKWAPALTTYGADPVMYFTFSSPRAYGLRRAAGMWQLWMAAFRPNVARTGDGSAPAFWLPFQQADRGNHIAQWTTDVPRRMCATSMDCAPDEECLVLIASGRCVGRM